MIYTLDKKEASIRENFKTTYYMPVVLKRVHDFISGSGKAEKEAVKLAFDNIHDFMRDSEAEMNCILEERKKAEEITNTDQARKSIAGTIFVNLIVDIFLRNKEFGNIAPEIFITTSKSEIKKKFGEDFIIHIDGEKQSPDCDLIIYNSETKRLMILSLKTSLRERAGQTYKWKLLLEIAYSKDTELRKKYNISHKGEQMPLICFATVNFYKEVNNPQHRGMFKFFDKAFIARPNSANSLVVNMSEIIDFIKDKM